MKRTYRFSIVINRVTVVQRNEQSNRNRSQSTQITDQNQSRNRDRSDLFKRPHSRISPYKHRRPHERAVSGGPARPPTKHLNSTSPE
ncbi:hypothetical protein CUMW_257090 [Citrus unshiu]|uniref:Uncharacterized protein n=1 Tax=Citrus unshiu TaxID=55188 RepID=A0A2H5QSB7_CITUN|nr:hypothetical protein CUMW_257090 [Citrus unshiu]